MCLTVHVGNQNVFRHFPSLGVCLRDVLVNYHCPPSDTSLCMHTLAGLPVQAIRAPAPAINTAYSRSSVTMSPPTGVHVCVDGVPFQYQLTDDDLMKVFSRYGSVSNITVLDEGGAAVVQFTSSMDADRAASALDGKVLNGVHGALRVTLFPSVPSTNTDNAQSRMSSPVLGRKYTCRFEIPANMDHEFGVAKRIIGQKGANMKKIVSALPSIDAAKLRLRGRGSGFLEGPFKQESSEALHLCVSCRDSESYSIVIREVTSLLEDVYKQYDDWCAERGYSNSENRRMGFFPEHHSSNEGQQYSAPKSLYPPSWNNAHLSMKLNREFGRTPSPQSFSTHPGPSAVNTPLEIPSPRSHSGLDIPTIERLIEERNEARRVCNFREADRLRDILRSYGVGLMDEPGARGKGTEVTSWRLAGRK
jgi:hypothetical protein